MQNWATTLMWWLAGPVLVDKESAAGDARLAFRS